MAGGAGLCRYLNPGEATVAVACDTLSEELLNDPNLIPGVHAPRAERALGDLESPTIRPFGCVELARVFGAGIHVDYLENLAFDIEKRNRKREQCVLHVETGPGVFEVKEDHPEVLGQFIALHQSDRSQLRFVRDFDLEQNGAFFRLDYRGCATEFRRCLGAGVVTFSSTSNR